MTTTLASIIPKQSTNHQANLYSASPTQNQANQYSQSYNQANQSVTYNQANQSIVSITQIPENQSIDSVAQNSINQSIEYINPNPVSQTAVTTNPVNQPMESVSHNLVNQAIDPAIHNQSNQYAESRNQTPGIQYIDEPISESPNQSTLNPPAESQVDQGSQHSPLVNTKNNTLADSKKTYSLSTKYGVKREQSGEVLIPPSPLSKEYRLKVLPQEKQQPEDLPAQEPPFSANGETPTSVAESMTVTSSSPSNSNSSAVQTHSMKSFVETYSYTVVSPTSSGQGDMSPEKDNVQKVGTTDFYPIIKLKRLKPQDPLGKQDSVEKHPQKAIVKPQMLALPESYLTPEQPESFSVSLL